MIVCFEHHAVVSDEKECRLMTVYFLESEKGGGSFRPL